MSPPARPTVVHLLALAAAQRPHAEALVCGDRRLDYRAFAGAVAAFAERLEALGARGSRVATLLPNSIEACVATFAAMAAGAQLVPLNPLYTARELEEILGDAEPAVLALPPGRAPPRTTAKVVSVPTAPVSGPPPLPDPESLALLQYTGGTTGRAKGVNLTHRAIAANVAQREALLPTATDRERILCVMPLFHSYALSMGLFLAVNCRGTLVIMERYRPDELLATVVAERITIFPGSPTLFTGLLGHPDFARTDWSRVHTCYSGAAPLPEATLRRWEQAVGAPVYEGYGQTEAGPVLTFNPVRGARKPGSVGIPVPGTEIEVVDVAKGDTVLPPGERGEIRARGPQIMTGYRNRPEETAEALRHGWLYTGDIGELDAEGYLYIRDRKKDMVIVGGYNVYPREVEEVLCSHPAVAEAGVVGAPDAYRGEVLCAQVSLRPGADTDAGALLGWCADRLAKYKLPSAIEIVDALPKTAVGKLDRNALRARWRSA